MLRSGQRVICNNSGFPEEVAAHYQNLPLEGETYTVRDVVPGQDMNGTPRLAVLLEELCNKPNEHGIEPGFQTWRFTPE